MDLETIKLKIRKNKDTIHVDGYGVLIFMLWSLIKIILYSIDATPENHQSVDSNFNLIYLSSIISISLIEDILTVITGYIAIQVGKKNKPRYVALVVLSVITCILSLEFVAGDIWLCIVIANEAIGTAIVGIITDALFLALTLSLTISAIKLNKLRKLEKGG